jgi:hypothetical protein
MSKKFTFTWKGREYVFDKEFFDKFQEFRSMTPDERKQTISQGEKCNASWQVSSVDGSLYKVECRSCGTILQSGCVPKCLENKKASD